MARWHILLQREPRVCVLLPLSETILTKPLQNRSAPSCACASVRFNSHSGNSRLGLTLFSSGWVLSAHRVTTQLPRSGYQTNTPVRGRWRSEKWHITNFRCAHAMPKDKSSSVVRLNRRVSWLVEQLSWLRCLQKAI